MTGTFKKKNFKDILLQFTLSKPVFRVFGDYFKCFNNKMVISPVLITQLIATYQVLFLQFTYSGLI